jgi:DNA polymerase-3 subunit beta
MQAIIPARALSELARIATEGDQNITMIIPPGRGQVIFHMKDTELVSQLIDGNFPDYKVIVPRTFKTRTVVSTPALLKACRQAEIIAREGTNVARMNTMPAGDMKPGIVEISAQSEETGSSESKIDATIEGIPLLIAFNVRFLREVLEVIKTPNVSVETNAANTPAMIRPVGDDHFSHVIMPMHLGS